ncbi:DUF6686 family protein [Belliella kenyensis]
MREGFILTRCEHCDKYSLLYNQIMIQMNALDFEAFTQYVSYIEFELHYFPFFDGIDRVLLETFDPSIQFTLKEEEFYRLKGFLEEAKIQLAISSLLKQ